MYSYIHIPFCKSKCKYCRFASVGSLDSVRIQTYVSKLLSDISVYSGDVEKLDSIYFGGGTPSTLSIKQLGTILGAMESQFLFSKNIEITLETTPENITHEYVNDCIKLGVNRFSVGVQTLNEKALQEIARSGKGDIFRALDILEKSDIGKGISISLDFIIGLPHVKKGELQGDIELILDRYDFVTHVSVYMLEDYYEEGGENRYENVTYPEKWRGLGLSEEDFLGEYLGIKEMLEERGFSRYEISNFAKPGFSCRHNTAYWNHNKVVAFGLGAHGFQNGKRYEFSSDFPEYYADKGKIVEELQQEDIFLEKLMFGLRTGGVDKDVWQQLNQEKLEDLTAQGYLSFQAEKLCLCDKATTLLDTIITELLYEE